MTESTTHSEEVDIVEEDEDEELCEGCDELIDDCLCDDIEIEEYDDDEDDDDDQGENEDK